MAFKERQLNLATSFDLAEQMEADFTTRRADLRISMPDHWIAVLFTSDGNELTANVENTSPRGAELLLPYGNGEFFVEPEARLTLTIRSTEREFSRIVWVCWTNRHEDCLRMGIAYIDHTEINSGSHQLSLEYVRVDPACALRIPGQIAVRRKLLPFAEIDDIVHVACVDSQNVSHLPGIERMLRKTPKFWEVDETALEKLIAQVYGNGVDQNTTMAVQSSRRVSGAENQTTAALTEEILYAAYLSRASDIHIDPHQNGVTIRFRVDGRLDVHQQLPIGVYQELVSRLKVMGGLDIAEKRAPQDGRFSHQFTSGSRRIDVRVATLPTKYGERMTLRLLALETETMTLSRLGLSQHHKEYIEHFLRRSQGMMILTGPTGSGKTTTLYPTIRILLL